MDLTVIVKRLDGYVRGVKYVKYAMSLPVASEDALKQQTGDQWLYVIPGPSSAFDSQLATDGQDAVGVDQYVPVEFGLWLFTKNKADKLGAGAKDVLEPVRESYRDRLLGWMPDECEAPITFVRGAPQGFSDYVSVHADTFRTAVRYVAVNTYQN